MLLRLILVVSILFGTTLRSFAQTEPAASASHVETNEEFLSRVTPAQKQVFDDANKAQVAGNYPQALAQFQSLLKDYPDDPIITKFIADVSLKSGDFTDALSRVKPVAEGNPEDWQAAILITEAYADAGNKVERDKAMAHLVDLHNRGLLPSTMQQYVIERTKVGDNTLVIYQSLEPYGYYRIYNMARATNKRGALFLTITIENNEGNQVPVTKSLPNGSTMVVQPFSLDAYLETGTNSNGQRTQTHLTYGFFSGQPPYDTVREKFIGIVATKIKPISSRENLVVP